MIISFPDVARIRREKTRAAGRDVEFATETAARRVGRRGASDRRDPRQDGQERETARRARYATVGGGGSKPDHLRMPPDHAAWLVEDIRLRVGRRPELVAAVSAYLSPTAGDRL